MTTCLCPACQRAMWSSKMAARWRGSDGNLNAGNSDFLASNTPSELVATRGYHVEGAEVDTQSCMDQSILAIFENSTVPSEVRTGAEEESETLLSALTEMLDSVEDDDRTLSPFDTLPNTKLLTHPESRKQSGEPPLAEKFQPTSNSSNETFTLKIDGGEEHGCKIEKNNPRDLFKQQQPTLFPPKNTKAEAEVEVFTSTSLVNLVRIMHPYCLKLHVEEDQEKLRRDHMFFSQEEVWKYERPTEESDEEIDVVSDDDGAGKEEKGREKGHHGGRLLKSALLNGNSSREKKRVSFGPVQVASFDQSLETGLAEKGLTSGSVLVKGAKGTANPAGSACDPQKPSTEVDRNKAEVLQPKGQKKVKLLSLQQYRQLRQKRQPLVEKQRNYTTKWPSVSEPLQELTPILCLQGPKPSHQYPDGRRSGAEQRHRAAGQNTHLTSSPLSPHPSEAALAPPLRRSALKRPRPESRILSPASPLPGAAVEPPVFAAESKKSPMKKPTLLSSDPPNPVLLSLPVSRTASPTTDQSLSESTVEPPNKDSILDSTRHFQGIQTKSSGASLQQPPSSSGLNPEVSSHSQDCTTVVQGRTSPMMTPFASSRSPALCLPTAQIQPSSLELQPQEYSLMTGSKPEPKIPQSPNPVDAPVQGKQPLVEVHRGKPPTGRPLPSQSDCGELNPTAVSGIEASDLTSLLEQFEETQAKEQRAEPPVELNKSLSSSDSPETPKTHRKLPHLQMPEGEHIPEPLGNDIILSTQQDQPTRHKNPPTKAIQIIDPRPLPSKKTHSNLSELPSALVSPHAYSSIAADHDYCGPADRLPANTTQRSRASKLKDISKPADLQATAQDSGVAAEYKQTSTCELSTSVTTTVTHLPKEHGTRPETAPEPDEVPPLSENSATQPACDSSTQDKMGPCTLPTPPPSPLIRGRDRRRYRSDSSSCSSSSSSSSCSTSRSPKRQKRRHTRSESSSCSPSPPRSLISRSPPCHYRWAHSGTRCSRSRSRSWSRSRSPSRSPSPVLRNCRRKWRDVYSSRESRRLRREHEIRIQKLKAIDERRVVYVGRICRSMTHDELRERFSQFGEVECVSLHFRDRGDHYGFVTFYNMNDAFAAIDNGSKLRRPDELPFDLCFGGRRQFCNSDYADLDDNRDADPSPAKSKFEDLDFDQLLKQAQKGLKR